MFDRPALTEREVGRMQFRLDLFSRRGFSTTDAETLADKLAMRDWQRDDRYCCAECAHLQERGTCFAAARGWIPNTARNFTPVRTLLQRCESFTFQKPA